MTSITADDILEASRSHLQARGKAHDPSGMSGGERNIGRIVAAFNAVTGRDKKDKGVGLSEEEGWLFMVLLKLVRSQTGSKPNRDNYEDGAAYIALMGEEALKGVEAVKASGVPMDDGYYYLKNGDERKAGDEIFYTGRWIPWNHMEWDPVQGGISPPCRRKKPSVN